MASACFYLNDPATMNASGAGRHGWAPTNSSNLYGGDGGVCVYMCVCARACERACLCACVCACGVGSPMRVRGCVMCLQYTIIIVDPC